MNNKKITAKMISLMSKQSLKSSRIPKYPHPCVIAHRFVKLG